MKHSVQKKSYITEEDFNKIVIDRSSANPMDDSRGDSSINETLEAEMGEHYPEGNVDDLEDIEDEDRGHNVVDSDREKIQSDINSSNHKGTSSTWPDPSEIDSEEVGQS